MLGCMAQQIPTPSVQNQREGRASMQTRSDADDAFKWISDALMLDNTVDSHFHYPCHHIFEVDKSCDRSVDWIPFFNHTTYGSARSEEAHSSNQCPIRSTKVVGIHGLRYPQEESEGSFPSQKLSSKVEYSWSPTPSLMSELSSIQFQPSLTLPQEEMEIDNKVILPHLLEAFGEAMEQGHKAQSEEILRCMSQKVSPLGESNERLAFYLSQEVANHGDYLKGEALKNFEAALRAFYQGMPDGKVAHFAAISAILEAIRMDCDAIHIVDSYMGLGVQWIPMIEALARMNRTLKLTSINWGDESPGSMSTPWNFEETRRQLYEHARSCGLKLMVEEKGVEELVTELKKMNKRGRRKEFLAFNCMVGLPHMGKVRRRQTMELLLLAKDLINNSENKGIITFGDGDAFEKLKSSLNFRSFFDGLLVHYHALLESIESHFPTRFSEARTAMESIFVAPYISPFGKFHQMFREARSEQRLDSDIIVCLDSVDKLEWDMQGISQSRSVNGKHLLGQLVSISQSIQEKLLDLEELIFKCAFRKRLPQCALGRCPQNHSPSLHAGSNLRKKLNILPSMIQVKLISTTTENKLSQDNEGSCVVTAIDLMKGVKWDSNSIITSQQLDYSTDCNLNKHKETMPKDPMFHLDDTSNQHKRKETARCLLSLAIFTIMCLWFLFMTSSQTDLGPLHKERGPMSIWVPLLGLLGFMVSVWAVGIMILAGGLSRLQSAMLLFWAILMQFVTLL